MSTIRKLGYLEMWKLTLINSFAEQLDQVFAETPEWDLNKQYKVENLSLYFENSKRQNIRLNLQSTLLEALMLEKYAKVSTFLLILLIYLFF